MNWRGEKSAEQLLQWEMVRGLMWGALQMERKDLGGHRVRHRLKEALIAILCKCQAGHWPFLTSDADGRASPENTQAHSFT